MFDIASKTNTRGAHFLQPQFACAQKRCISVDAIKNRVVSKCENKFSRALAVHGVAHHEDELPKVADGNVESSVRSPVGSSIEFRYSQLMDFDRIGIFWAPVGKPGFTDAKSAYHFDVQCKHKSKWVTVYKYPHADPCASREKCTKAKGCNKQCKKYKPLTHRDFFRLKPGWKMLSFSQGTTKDASSPSNPWQTTVSKCPGPSAEWRVANMRPHPDVTQTGNLKELTTAEIVFAGDGQPQSIPSELPPLGGPCGVNMTRVGSTDVATWGKCKAPVANEMMVCTGSAPYAEVGSTVDCGMAIDKDPGTFTAFKHHGSIKYQNNKPQKIQQVWMYMHSAHRPSAQVDKFVFRCGDATQQFSIAPSTKGWTSFKLKEPCNALDMALEKLESKNSRSNHELPTIVVAEVRLTKANFAKADLPLPRNNKVQKSWCVRSQTVSLGAHKNFGRTCRGKGGPRLVASFKPKLDGIPCGSRIILRPLVHLKGGANKWGESWLFFEMWDDSKRLWKNNVRGVQKSKGKWRYFHAPFGGTEGRMARPAGGKVQLIARPAHGGTRHWLAGSKSIIHIDKTVMFDWWYSTPDPDTPCAD